MDATRLGSVPAPRFVVFPRAEDFLPCVLLVASLGARFFVFPFIGLATIACGQTRAIALRASRRQAISGMLCHDGCADSFPRRKARRRLCLAPKNKTLDRSQSRRAREERLGPHRPRHPRQWPRRDRSAPPQSRKQNAPPAPFLAGPASLKATSRFAPHSSHSLQRIVLRALPAPRRAPARPSPSRPRRPLHRKIASNAALSRASFPGLDDARCSLAGTRTEFLRQDGALLVRESANPCGSQRQEVLHFAS